MLPALLASCLAFSSPLGSKIGRRELFSHAAGSKIGRRELFSHAAGFAVALGPAAAFADGANSKATVEKARAIYGSRVVRLQGADAATILEEKNAIEVTEGALMLQSMESLLHEHQVDIVFTGHDGALILVSARTKQWVGNLKMNGSARAVAFTADENRLLSAGGDGKVYVWDLRARKCTNVFVDDGCTTATALAVAPNDAYVACASDAGVVNVYDGGDCFGSGAQPAPKPAHTFLNLTTAVDSVEWHPSGQMLGFSSRLKKEAFRLAQAPALSVFSNWPTQRTPLGYVHSFAFSPHGGYVAAGNDKGKALLYRLNHFGAV